MTVLHFVQANETRSRCEPQASTWLDCSASCCSEQKHPVNYSTLICIYSGHCHCSHANCIVLWLQIIVC